MEILTVNFVDFYQQIRSKIGDILDEKQDCLYQKRINIMEATCITNGDKYCLELYLQLKCKEYDHKGVLLSEINDVKIYLAYSIILLNNIMIIQIDDYTTAIQHFFDFYLKGKKIIFQNDFHENIGKLSDFTENLIKEIKDMCKYGPGSKEFNEINEKWNKNNNIFEYDGHTIFLDKIPGFLIRDDILEIYIGNKTITVNDLEKIKEFKSKIQKLIN